MFDIGFWELGLIAVVALLVIGPERLPAVARTVGFWMGKIRQFVFSVQSDFNREVIKTEELKELLEEQSKIKDVHEILEQSVDQATKNVSVKANLFKNDTPAQEDTDATDTKAIESAGHNRESSDPNQKTASTIHDPTEPVESVNDKTK